MSTVRGEDRTALPARILNLIDTRGQHKPPKTASSAGRARTIKGTSASAPTRTMAVKSGCITSMYRLVKSEKSVALLVGSTIDAPGESSGPNSATMASVRLKILGYTTERIPTIAGTRSRPEYFFMMSALAAIQKTDDGRILL